MLTEFKAEISPKFRRRLLKLHKRLSRAPFFGPLIKGYGVTESQILGNDTRPEWLKNLAKKIHNAATFERYAGKKSEAWKYGLSCGGSLAALSVLPKYPDWYSNSLSKEQADEFINLIHEFVRKEREARRNATEQEIWDFCDGSAYGSKNFVQPNDWPAGATYTRFKLDLLLTALGEHVEEFQTTTELYNFLLGDDNPPPPWLGDLEDFQRYCRELGIRLGPRGRPASK
jgi:hypothetical protein